jgi:hypothetical protein
MEHQSCPGWRSCRSSTQGDRWKARPSPGAALSVVDVDDAVPVHLEASHLWVRSQVSHDAAHARANPEIDGPAGQVQGLASPACAPVAPPAAMGGLDTHGAEFGRNGCHDLTQISRNAIGRSAGAAYSAGGITPPSASPALSTAGDDPNRNALTVKATLDAWRTRALVLIGFSRFEPPHRRCRRKGPPNGISLLLAR